MDNNIINQLKAKIIVLESDNKILLQRLNEEKKTVKELNKLYQEQKEECNKLQEQIKK